VGLLDAFFRKHKSEETPTDPAEATDSNERQEAPPALGVVFAEPRSYTGASLEASLRSVLPGVTDVKVQAKPDLFDNGTPIARISWGPHQIDLVGFDLPLPAKVLEKCIAAAHYGQDTKAAVRAQKAHALLYYAAENQPPLEQYVALAAVAAAMANHQALAVLNESAMTSLPAGVVHELATKKPDLLLLRHMPLLMLFCGFVKYFTPEMEMWVRTYNCPRFGLPDLAMWRSSPNKAEETFQMFDALLNYLLSSGKRFAPGHTAQLGEAALRFRAPRDDAPFPTHTAGQLLIVKLENGPA
jgi:hypothetical protein